MDRGIKIAIVIACMLSLGLGLIWDSLIDTTRTMIDHDDSPSVSSMTPDKMSLRVGDTTQPAPKGRTVTSDNATPLETPAVDGPSDSPQPASSGDLRANELDRAMPDALKPFVSDGCYKVQQGDNWWKIANSASRFKFLGMDSTDWKAANPDVVARCGDNLRTGIRIKIPG